MHARQRSIPSPWEHPHVLFKEVGDELGSGAVFKEGSLPISVVSRKSGVNSFWERRETKIRSPPPSCGSPSGGVCLWEVERVLGKGALWPGPPIHIDLM